MATEIGPINLDRLLAGSCRVLVALPATPGVPPATVGIPTDLSGIIALAGSGGGIPTPVAGWTDIGATEGGGTYERGLTSKDYSVDQRTGPVLSEVTGTDRQFSVTVAEISRANLVLIEEATVVREIAAAPGKSAQTVIGMGSIEELTRRRVAFIGRRKKSQALVTEPGGATRGAYLGGVLLTAALTADKASIQFAPGQLASVKITFQAFGDPSGAPGEDEGVWFEEHAGVIA